MRNGGMTIGSGRRAMTRRRAVWGAVGIVALSTSSVGSAGASSDEDSDSPLADLMGWEPSEPAEDRRRQLEQEELTSECMRELGWEYEPVDWSAMSGADVGAEDWELQSSDPEAYGEKYGYGVMRGYELYEAGYLEGGGVAATVPMDDGPEFVDPNQEYVESLSESEREQYYIDLYGDMSAFEDSEGDVAVSMPSPEEMGCSGQAGAEIWGDGMGGDPAVQERIQEYYEGLQDDPRWQAATDEWVECMGDIIDGYTGWEGGPVASPDDMWSVFETKKYEAQGLERVPFEDESELDGLEYSSMMSNMDGSGVAWVGEAEPIGQDELDALIDEEIEAWQQDQECSEESDLKDIRLELEQDLVDQLLDEFPELATTGGGD